MIRRELQISPGNRSTLGRWRTVAAGLRDWLFESVRLHRIQRPGTRLYGGKLLVSVKESNTGRFQIGGGFSTDYGAFAHVIVAQENFDIMRWRRPYFWRGGGQKIRLRTTAGGRFNNYELDFEEPWLMGKKLRFTTTLHSGVGVLPR